jgi:hypothetical protein
MSLLNCASDNASIEDLRVLAQRRLPTALFDNLDGGAEELLSSLLLRDAS